MRLPDLNKYTNFNPRSHEGSDLDNEGYYSLIEISIHAPTRGATVPCVDRPSIRIYFNPRSHEGSDKRIQKILFV